MPPEAVSRQSAHLDQRLGPFIVALFCGDCSLILQHYFIVNLHIIIACCKAVISTSNSKIFPTYWTCFPWFQISRSPENQVQGLGVWLSG